MACFLFLSFCTYGGRGNGDQQIFERSSGRRNFPHFCFFPCLIRYGGRHKFRFRETYFGLPEGGRFIQD
uniref:Putative secreted protein n=1 Tax=Ixodes ricinus TaxID=34613 RepID=A0A6B0U1Q1_IXORI